jgi:hypothetical protein
MQNISFNSKSIIKAVNGNVFSRFLFFLIISSNIYAVKIGFSPVYVLIPSLFLFAVYFNWITKIQFVYSLVFIYAAMMFLMAIVAFKVRKPQFHLKFPKEKREIIIYSSFIIFSSPYW